MSDRKKTKKQLTDELLDARRRIAELQKEVQEPADAEERKQADKEMRRMATVVRDSNDAITIQDFDGRVLAWNRGAELMYGYSEDEALQMSVWRLTPPDREAEQKEFVRRLMAGEAVTSFETQRVTKDGRILDVWLTVTELTDDTGEPIGTASTERDITERKRAEDALRASEDRFRQFFENQPEYCYMISPDGRILDVNRAALQVLEYEKDDLVGKPRDVIYAPESRERMAEVLEAWKEHGHVENEELVIISRTGQRRTVLLSGDSVRAADGTLLHSVSVQRDVTELRAIEAQLLQAQKMESIGRLAGGVAHDFNNLLTGIKGCAGFALEAAEPGSQAHEDLTEVLALSDRAADLTRQLLAFSRRQTLEPVVVNVNALIADQANMLTRLLREDIELRFLPASDPGNVRADPGQIEQIIMNLAVNARDAMPDGGRLTIETANVELGEDYARTHVGVDPGPYVMIAISDTGCGMDEKTRAQIFEPFFTTKELGKGTGLGLSTVYGIAKQHGGSIWVYSEPGKGMTFKIYLPRVMAEAGELRPKSEFIVGGEETILLVEDDDAVRDVGRRHLEALGYAVLCASSAGEAEEVAQGHEGRIDLLLTDVVMPGGNGRELYESMAANRAGLKVLYMSGYTDNAIVHHGVLEEGIPFLQKPFERENLAAKVRQALEG